MAATVLHVMLPVIYGLLATRGIKGNGCEGYGECGLNAICQVIKNSSQCSCPPGFEFVNKENPSKGCFQNPPPEKKKCSGEMKELRQLDWSGNDYQIISPASATGCKQACLEDCFCTVVIHATLDGIGYCWKKALPLRDGRLSITRTAFFKVSKITAPL